MGDFVIFIFGVGSEFGVIGDEIIGSESIVGSIRGGFGGEVDVRVNGERGSVNVVSYGEGRESFNLKVGFFRV